jgi:hypothetical protein
MKRKNKLDHHKNILSKINVQNMFSIFHIVNTQKFCDRGVLTTHLLYPVINLI